MGYIHLGHSWNLAASSIDDATGTMDGYAVVLYEGTIPEDSDTLPSSIPDEQDGRPSLPPRSVSAAKILGKRTDLLQDSLTPDIDEVEEDYIRKKASVFSLNLLDKSLYREGLILKKGAHRIAVISIDESSTRMDVESKVEQLGIYEVDFLVAITPDMELLIDVPGIDIVISTQKEDVSLLGETKNGTFYITAPALESLGVIFVSPSNVVSAKVLEG